VELHHILLTYRNFEGEIPIILQIVSDDDCSSY
jgi:hypothetical protein